MGSKNILFRSKIAGLLTQNGQWGEFWRAIRNPRFMLRGGRMMGSFILSERATTEIYGMPLISSSKSWIKRIIGRIFLALAIMRTIRPSMMLCKMRELENCLIRMDLKFNILRGWTRSFCRWLGTSKIKGTCNRNLATLQTCNKISGLGIWLMMFMDKIQVQKKFIKLQKCRKERLESSIVELTAINQRKWLSKI